MAAIFLPPSQVDDALEILNAMWHHFTSMEDPEDFEFQAATITLINNFTQQLADSALEGDEGGDDDD